ncbi:DUF6265 family protein [Pedobacter frigoris]|uniref:DUF6265 domain-containing protein n=1 Tax=Pedobacter frigoris TaxID=2571272 RepID=A0A4U1CH31_9SPHI|nr:DUF6265 family protein [Pedobacter frigoris]TKC05877.1 hypothetical protein FA047_11070 [Pedobacter frigoris]
MKTQQTKFIILFTLLMSIGRIASAQESTAQQFKKLEWLIGKWQRTNPKAGQSGYENWEKVSGIKLIGKGITLEGKKTVFEEQLELSVQDNQIFYKVRLTGDSKLVAFKLTSISKDAFVCENPEHDFPKKIAYTRNGKNVKAVISGNGHSVDYEFSIFKEK